MKSHYIQLFYNDSSKIYNTSYEKQISIFKM